MALSTDDLGSREAEAIIIVKAAPQAGQRHGEVVCCAGMDLEGNWLRLYPVSFRTLEESQKFARWDRIRFQWRLPSGDNRSESRRVDQHTIKIVGQLKAADRSPFLGRSIVTSLRREMQEGRSLALLKAEIEAFLIEKKTRERIEAERTRFDEMRARAAEDLFNTTPIIPHTPCPYRFRYRYRMDDGTWEGTCQDWEIEATFFRWSQRYGEERALAKMQRMFGEVYPQKGMLLAMGTHRRWKDRWLINGIVRFDEDDQLPLI